MTTEKTAIKPPSESVAQRQLYCSFCGKSKDEVRKLIAGPSIFICDECIDLCNEILKEEAKASNVLTTAASRLSVRLRALSNRFHSRYKSMPSATIEFVFWAFLGAIVVLQIVTLVLVVAK